MTRANITIITRQGKFHFQGNSSMYPSNTMEDIFKFATSTAAKQNGRFIFYDEPECRDLATFIDSVGLTLGQIGNPSYFYEIDFKSNLVRVWESKTRWINAPEDWKARGWNCYQNSKGKYGWDSWVKGKMILQLPFRAMFTTIKEREPVINKTELKKAILL